MMEKWNLSDNLPPEVSSYFGSVDKVFSIRGLPVSCDWMSVVLRIEIAGKEYYVKRYYHAGNLLRKYLGFPRVVREWKNLQFFHQQHIPTANLVAHGAQYQYRFFHRGALVTSAIPDTKDLASLAKEKPELFRDRQWLGSVIQQLATITCRLHQKRFAHNDLKWRNILVDTSGKVFLIDCPNGLFWIPPFLEYRIIKDLACIDKAAKHHVSRTQRMRFYLQYAGKSALELRDKKRIRQILGFFAGRE